MEKQPNAAETAPPSFPNRRQLLTAGAATATAALALPAALRGQAAESATAPTATVRPQTGKGILLSPKLSMLPKELKGKRLSLAERLALAGEAGFDGVDLDQAGAHTEEEARAAVRESGVFVHNAINHAHWKQRLTSADPEVRAQGVKNIAHCIRVSHAAGGNGVLIVVGRANDGTREDVEERCRQAIRSLLPLAAALGQPILIENVWNQMFYDHTKKPAPPEQGPERFIEFVDSFNSPWVGMYYDIGNHWKYGQPGDWIRGFGRRCVKLDVKGFSRERDKFADITEGDLPWKQVQQALGDIGFTGWATAEVGGGGPERLKKVRAQMEEAFGL